jgi:hypothetical protein
LRHHGLAVPFSSDSLADKTEHALLSAGNSEDGIVTQRKSSGKVEVASRLAGQIAEKLLTVIV